MLRMESAAQIQTRLYISDDFDHAGADPDVAGKHSDVESE